MAFISPIQLLRSIINNKRPDPAQLLPGQPAVNTNENQPGLFFADSSGSNLVKIGPCYVGADPPNSTDIGPVTEAGNSKGELWLDQSFEFGPLLRVWSGTAWVASFPITFAKSIVSATEPATTYLEGTNWWNSEKGCSYILYQSKWIQTGSLPST